MKTEAISSRFLYEATDQLSSRFLREATGLFHSQVHGLWSAAARRRFGLCQTRER
jgi:hypothetical protein